MELSPSELEPWMQKYRLPIAEAAAEASAGTSSSTSSASGGGGGGGRGGNNMVVAGSIRYYNRGAMKRLQYIIDSPEASLPLKIEASRLLCSLLKEGKATKMYTDAIQRWRELSGDASISIDSAWVSKTSAELESRKKMLDSALAAVKGSSQTDQIKNCCIDLAHYSEDMVDLNEATKNFNTADSFATDLKEKCDISVHITLFFIETSSFSEFQKQERMTKYKNALYKVYNAKSDIEVFKVDQRAETTLKIMSGLLHLSNRKYVDAAHSFLNIPFPYEPVTNYASTISSEDVSLIGALLSVAFFNHFELKSLLDPQASSEHYKKSFDEYLKQDDRARRLISLVVNREYFKFFEHVRSLLPKLKLDMYFSGQVKDIVDAMKGNMICHYFVPFSRVSLNKMAEHLSLDRQELDERLVKLISRGTIIGARIDGVNGILLRKNQDDFSLLMKKAENVYEDHFATLNSCILRASIVSADLSVKEDRPDRGLGRSSGMAGSYVFGYGEGEGGDFDGSMAEDEDD